MGMLKMETKHSKIKYTKPKLIIHGDIKKITGEKGSGNTDSSMSKPPGQG